MNLLDLIALSLFSISQIALFLFGVHYFFVIRIYQRNRDIYQKKTPFHPLDEYPKVTIQVPVFNEKFVIEKIILNLLLLDYPRNRLQIQILDDSTDETTSIVEKTVKKLRKNGYDIDHIHRDNRINFKAGALNYGLEYAEGDYIAIFDADFMPKKSFLSETIPFFLSNFNLGCIQTRWGHQNKDESIFTRTVALGIDGHFIVEQNVRSTLNVINFNGTCGIWRKKCIIDSGGWDGKILAEDLDLSYRAHIKGWKFKYLQNTICLGEIPNNINSFKQQQYRWAKGSSQSAKKNLLNVWRSDNFSFIQKMESTFHHFGYFVQFFMFILLISSIYLINQPIFNILSISLIFALMAIAAPSMYIISALEIGYSLKNTIYTIFYLTILGAGISYNTGYAAFIGLFQKEGEFKRTPKKGNYNFGYFSSFSKELILEIFLTFFSLFGIVESFIYVRYLVIPFLLIFFLGYFWVSYLGIKQIFTEIKINLNKQKPIENNQQIDFNYNF